MTTSTSVFALVLLATVLLGLLAGSALDRGLVSFPARRRIGALAWARYCRAADLGNGLFLYPLLAIGGALAALAALLLAWIGHGTRPLLVALSLAAVGALGTLAVTAFAAPKMFRLGQTDDREELLAPLVEGFVKLSYVRLLFICESFCVLLWALVLVSGAAVCPT